jgi:hypothetical protein
MVSNLRLPICTCCRKKAYYVNPSQVSFGYFLLLNPKPCLQPPDCTGKGKFNTYSGYQIVDHKQRLGPSCFVNCKHLEDWVFTLDIQVSWKS